MVHPSKIDMMIIQNIKELSNAYIETKVDTETKVKQNNMNMSKFPELSNCHLTPYFSKSKMNK